MTERSGDKLVVSGVSRNDLEFALGFIGISDYKIEPVQEPVQLGTATLAELKEFAEQSGLNPQLVTRLESRISRYYPEILTKVGSIDLDLLAERLENADKWFAAGKKTVGLAQSFIASKHNAPEEQI
jgi:hypothetical protein